MGIVIGLALWAMAGLCFFTQEIYYGRFTICRQNYDYEGANKAYKVGFPMLIISILLAISGITIFVISAGS